ncbi:hypothetical protein [Neotabrizicola sp. sgz301269]|uniref:hypothetical protein n=1 Tax=Neotabrizicola sp. sgz301269 TaxID=3276282 RepID=UPI00376FB0A7
MATHHGRPGGRSGEVGLLFLTVIATVLLIGGGIFLPLLLTQATGSSSYFASKAGAAMGFVVSALLWRKLLSYYRYEAHTLRPIKEDETNDRDAH